MKSLLFLIIFSCGVLSGCSTGGEKKIKDKLACLLIDKKLHNAKESTDLYMVEDGECKVADLTKSGDYYADAQCTSAIDFYGTKFRKYCNTYFHNNGSSMGDPRDWPEDISSSNPVILGGKETKWSRAYGVELNVFNLDAKNLPYRKSVLFKTVSGCQLGMNIYKDNLTFANQKIALYIHGGGWRFRSAVIDVSIDMMSSLLTSRGYVVFAPYYRQVSASTDVRDDCKVNDGLLIQDDVSDAVHWVVENGEQFGADANEMNNMVVYGHSAGAQLSAYLLETNSRFRKTLIGYGPNDGTFALKSYASGLYSDSDAAWDLLAGFLGETSTSTLKEPASLSKELIIQNTYTDSSKVGAFQNAEVHIIHGIADTTVPVEMSSRLCDAMASKTLFDVRYSGGQKLPLSCGANSKAYFVDSADHGLELKCLSEARFFSKLFDLYNFFTHNETMICPSGSSANDTVIKSLYNNVLNNF